ncbi:cholinesterase 1-like [Patiria miniata]|uniref:Carboxylesterase type B domain-containing protein n=1 Tax=Patiria miniata TaxID=46514 RepID=A0A913Z698_PATMI|nr:cholinesterase 1-like [Patiria miniata]
MPVYKSRARKSNRLPHLLVNMGNRYIAIVALGVFLAQTMALDQPTVTVEQGVLVGTTETFEETQFINVNKTIDVFKGIPFAEPPVGPLRFRPPVEKKPWVGTYDATNFRDACMQNPAYVGNPPVSEDCLHLNIYAPKPALPEGAPVMVWIHGGGFSSGSSRELMYQGQSLVASGDVIVVSINYRLNAFGFLTTGDEALPGNVGLMDQVLALKWIKENIAAFGGDRNRVTIYGQAAGSASVSFHILSQLSEGLFDRAIMQSGTAFSPWAFSEDMERLRKQAFDIGQKLGCGASESTALVNCLRDKNATDIDRALGSSFHFFAAVVDGSFLVDTPEALYAAGRYNHVDLLLGTTKDEGTLFILDQPRFSHYVTSKEPPTLSRQDFDELIDGEVFLDGKMKPVDDAIRMQYIDWSKADFSDHDYFRSFVEYATDFYFASGTDMVARFHFNGNDSVFLYQMTHVPSVSIFRQGGPGWLGCGNAEDISFVFGLPFISNMAPLYAAFTDEERGLSVEFMQFWTSFAETGNPGVQKPRSPPDSQRTFWPRFTVPEIEYKELSLNMNTSRALKSQQSYFWNSYIIELNNMLVPEARTTVGSRPNVGSGVNIAAFVLAGVLFIVVVIGLVALILSKKRRAVRSQQSTSDQVPLWM